MAKKNLKYFIPGAIALVLGIVAFCMMFLPAITFNAGDSSSDGWTGAQIAFGYKESFLGQEITVLNFNFLVFLAFLLPLVGGILALLFKNGLITKIVTTACFVVGAVLLFSIVGLSGIGRVSLEEGNIINEAVNAVLDELYKAIDSTKGMGIGAILGAIFSIFLCPFTPSAGTPHLSGRHLPPRRKCGRAFRSVRSVPARNGAGTAGKKSAGRIPSAAPGMFR